MAPPLPSQGQRALQGVGLPPSDRRIEKPGLLRSKSFLPTGADASPCDTHSHGVWLRTAHSVFIYVDGPRAVRVGLCIEAIFRTVVGLRSLSCVSPSLAGH